MSMVAINRIRHVTTSWFRRQFETRALILLYHRVTEVDVDPWSLCVTPQHFAEHLEVLHGYAQPVSLQELGQVLHARSFRKLPRRSVIVTFDDGYADNLYHAKPLLDRYGVPATVFVTTGAIGREREFWWDELERLLLQPGTLPQFLRLRVNGKTHEWELGQSGQYSEESCARHRQWRTWDTGEPSSRHFLYRSIYKLLRPLPSTERRKVQDELLVWAGAKAAARPTHRSLSLHEVCALGQGGLVDIGAHTVTHPVLSALPVCAQRDEIQQSRAQLEEVLGRPVTAFSYPHGFHSGHTPEIVALVRELGFATACSTLEAVARRDTDPFALPRVSVGEWGGEQFSRWLRGWFSD